MTIADIVWAVIAVILFLPAILCAVAFVIGILVSPFAAPGKVRKPTPSDFV